MSSKLQTPKAFEMDLSQVLSKLLKSRISELCRDLTCLKARHDAAALHGARVSMRALNTTISSYGAYLRRSDAQKLAAKLRELNKLCGKYRDTNVQLELLSEMTTAIPSAKRSYAKELQKMLREQMQALRLALNSELALKANALIGSLQDEVAALNKPLWSPNFCLIFKEALQAKQIEFNRALSKARKNPSLKKLHQLRIKTKSLRYLISPVVTDLPQARHSLSQLKKLQNLIGEHRDLSLLSSKLKIPSLAKHSGQKLLKKHIIKNRKAKFNQIYSSYLASKTKTISELTITAG